MKRILIILLLLLSICLNHKNVYAYNNFSTKQLKSISQEELYNQSLLSLMYPYIANAVDKYYGYPKQFDLHNAKILSIKKPTEKFEYKITVQVETFTGPHNPPRGLETITILTSPSGTKVIKFTHKPE